mmetsp:Transcript_21147/g.49952  ORF Transcript_21147/g.49952 Transcript_21147/m.49952 type:complete len:277 (+) Transcript_21147:80-910(+)
MPALGCLAFPRSFTDSFTDSFADSFARSLVAPVLLRLGLFVGDSRAPKATGTPLRLGQILHFLDRSHADLFQNELGDAVPLVHDKVFLSQVEEDDADGAPVVGVHHPGTAVDSLLDGQARAGGDAGVRSGRTGDAQVRVDDLAAAGGNGCGSAGREVKAGGPLAAADRQGGVLREFLDEEGFVGHYGWKWFRVLVLIVIRGRRGKEQDRCREGRNEALAAAAAAAAGGGGKEGEREEPNCFVWGPTINLVDCVWVQQREDFVGKMGESSVVDLFRK